MKYICCSDVKKTFYFKSEKNNLDFFMQLTICCVNYCKCNLLEKVINGGLANCKIP